MKKLIIFLFTVICVLLNSCGIDEAKPSSRQKIVIVSDFLYAKDSKLFHDFEKKNNVKIYIQHLVFDSIQKKLKDESYTTLYDLVMLKSSLDMLSLQNNELLQKVLQSKSQPNLSYRYKSYNNDWYGIAIDPYVLVVSNDSVHEKVLDYNDLFKHSKWMSDFINIDDYKVLFASFHHKYRATKKDSLNLLCDRFFMNQQVFYSPNDSVKNFPVLLTNYSNLYTKQNLYNSGFKSGNIIFPNQSKRGTHYNLRSVGIVLQARNYTNAVEFLNYLCEEQTNQRINNWWNTFPVSNNKRSNFKYQQKMFKSYALGFDVLKKYEEDAIKTLSRHIKK